MATLEKIKRGQTVTEQVELINQNVENINEELVELNENVINNTAGYITQEEVPVKSVNNKKGDVSLSARDVDAFPNSSTIQELDINNLKETGVYIGTYASNPYYLIVIKYNDTNIYQELIGLNLKQYRRFTNTWSEWIRAYSNENPIKAGDITGIELVDTDKELNLALLEETTFVKSNIKYNPSTNSLYIGNEKFATESFVQNAVNMIKSVIVANLPETGVENTIYFVPNNDENSDNEFDEYVFVNGEWEILGGTSIDLTPFLTIENADKKYATIEKMDEKVSKKTTINGKTLYNNITLTAEDVGALSADTKIVGDVVYRHTNADISTKLTAGEFIENDVVLAIDDGDYLKGHFYKYSNGTLSDITDVITDYVDLSTDQTIGGIKNFNGVLRYAGSNVATEENAIMPLESPVRIWDLDDGFYKLPAGCVVYYRGATAGTSFTIVNTSILQITTASATNQKGFNIFGYNGLVYYGAVSETTGSYGSSGISNIPNLSPNTGNKAYLMGASSQTWAGLSYTEDNVYMEDGTLFSGGKEVGLKEDTVLTLESPVRVWELATGVYKLPSNCKVIYNVATSSDIVVETESFLQVGYNPNTNRKTFTIVASAGNFYVGEAYATGGSYGSNWLTSIPKISASNSKGYIVGAMGTSWMGTSYANENCYIENGKIYSEGKEVALKEDLDTKQDTLNASQLQAVNSGATSTNIGQITTNKNDISDLKTNKASIDFVNSSISTNTATFKGTYNTLAELQAVTADSNDYGFVISTDSLGNRVFKRYKYSDGSWVFEYDLNNSSFTAEQWSAINSGITSTLVGKITTNENNIANLQTNKEDKSNLKALAYKDNLTASDVGALPSTTKIPSVEGLASETYVDNATANCLKYGYSTSPNADESGAVSMTTLLDAEGNQAGMFGLLSSDALGVGLFTASINGHDGLLMLGGKDNESLQVTSSGSFYKTNANSETSFIDLPNKNGTIALTNDIPDTSSFINKDVNNLTNYTLSTGVGTAIDLSIDTTNYKVTAQLKNSSGTVLSSDVIDLPLESVVVNGTYDDTNKKVILTLQNGNTVEFSVADLVSGLASQSSLDTTNTNVTNLTTRVSTNETNISNLKTNHRKLEGTSTEPVILSDLEVGYYIITTNSYVKFFSTQTTLQATTNIPIFVVRNDSSSCNLISTLLVATGNKINDGGPYSYITLGKTNKSTTRETIQKGFSLNGSIDANSGNTYIYAPTTSGTSGQLLQSKGAYNEPTWITPNYLNKNNLVAGENISLSLDGNNVTINSLASGETTYDLIITNQSEFEYWYQQLDAGTFTGKSVLIVGQDEENPYIRSDGKGLHLPKTLFDLHGLGHPTIYIENFAYSDTNKGGIWHEDDEELTPTYYSIRDIDLILNGAGTCYGFVNCAGIDKCMSQCGNYETSTNAIAFDNCVLINNSSGVGISVGGSAYGFNNSQLISNCYGAGMDSAGGIGYTYNSCSNISNNMDMGMSTTAIYNNCSNVEATIEDIPDTSDLGNVKELKENEITLALLESGFYTIGRDAEKLKLYTNGVSTDIALRYDTNYTPMSLYVNKLGDYVNWFLMNTDSSGNKQITCGSTTSTEGTYNIKNLDALPTTVGLAGQILVSSGVASYWRTPTLSTRTVIVSTSVAANSNATVTLSVTEGIIPGKIIRGSTNRTAVAVDFSSASSSSTTSLTVRLLNSSTTAQTVTSISLYYINW